MAGKFASLITTTVVVGTLLASDSRRLGRTDLPGQDQDVSTIAVASAIGELIRQNSVASAQEQQEVKALYGPLIYSPLWLTAQWSLTPQGQAAISLLGQAVDHGLNPADYPALAAVRDASPRSIEALGRLDLDVSVSLLRFYRHLDLGRVDPQTLGFQVDAPAYAHDFVEIVRTARATGRLLETAEELTCPLPQYDGLRTALRRYRALAAIGDATPIAATPTVHPGETYAQLATLRRRLVALGDLSDQVPDPGPDALYAEPLVGAVARFQGRHGLETDGVIGRRTQAALAIPIGWRVRQIELALERLRWLPDLSASPLIAVNIPMFRLWAWDVVGRPPSLSMSVVVGRALDTQTPVFMARMPYVIFRPYWNVPSSIARAELLPALRKDPGRLVRDHLEIIDGGDDAPALPVTPETLARVARGPLRLRQRPGPDNALGFVKFVFPNPHDVYLHGTPAQALFSRSRRDFSHGCIRVEDPAALAEWVLGDGTAWSRARVKGAMQGADNRRVDLARPVQVLIFYLTAAVMPDDGSVHFAEDIYGHDARLDRALADLDGTADRP